MEANPTIEHLNFTPNPNFIHVANYEWSNKISHFPYGTEEVKAGDHIVGRWKIKYFFD